LALAGLAALTLPWRPSGAPALREDEILRVGAPGSVLARHGHRMIAVPPGTFTRGPLLDDPWAQQDEVRATVELTRPVLIGATEVTQALYAEVMGEDPSSYGGCPTCPVHDVTWRDAVRFCNRLSVLEGLQPAYDLEGPEVAWRKEADGYRLPTEAEWEYAARAGEELAFAGSDDPDRVAWYAETADQGPQPVARLRPNRWGFYDLSGNVWEWVWDRWSVPSAEPSVDPTGPPEGETRVGKGGAWNVWADMLRPSVRSRGHPTSRSDVIGFRLARWRDAAPDAAP
jgi:formylglycine-generating enzyme required for sulfatase activity